MSQGETGSELGAPAERLVRLARSELGEMSARRRAEGLLKLNGRSLPRARHGRFVLTFALLLVVVLAVSLIGAGARAEPALVVLVRPAPASAVVTEAITRSTGGRRRGPRKTERRSLAAPVTAERFRKRLSSRTPTPLELGQLCDWRTSQP